MVVSSQFSIGVILSAASALHFRLADVASQADEESKDRYPVFMPL
jgi:hypothetical protein